jgi:hypothetical protein
MEFRSYPLVIGALGPAARSGALAGFLDSIDGARSLIEEDGAVVRAVGPVATCSAGLHWGSPIPVRGQPRDWRDASERHQSAGVFGRPGRRVLFTDSVGVNPVYTRTIGDTVLFATRIAPLLGAEGRLTMNREAWAGILLHGFPVGSDSPFQEIDRLRAASGVAVGAHGRSTPSYTPAWIGDEMPPSPDLLVDALRAHLPARVVRRPPAVLLSGGWDSRLLAGLLARGGRRPVAWTTGQDDGRELDLEFAPAVADGLGLRHRIVELMPEAWPDCVAQTRRRLEYTTWRHAWMIPLARRMRPRETEVVDGLAGDLLIKGSLVEQRKLLDTSLARVTLFRRLGGVRRPFSKLLRRDAIDGLLEAARGRFDEEFHRFEGHRRRCALVELHTRNALNIARSPLDLLGPELRVWLPFLHPDVLRIGLSMNPADKDGAAGYGLYRRVLEAGVPSVAGLPSTNDPGLIRESRFPVRAEAAESVAWLAASIVASDTAMSLLRPRFVRALTGEGVDSLPNPAQAVRAMERLSLLAQWVTAHPDVRVDLHPWG